MSLSVSSVSSATAASAQDPAARATAIAKRMIKELDADGDGQLSKEEFVSGLQQKGVSAADAESQYDAIDTEGTGSLSQDDLSKAVQDGTLKPPPRPAQGEGGQGARGGGAGAAGGSSSKTYDKADLNQDGTVSEAERMIYEMRQAATQAAASEADKGRVVNETA